MADDLPELPLGYEPSGANPAFYLIPVPPSLHVPANRFDNREGGLDHLRSDQRAAELGRHARFVNSERFLHAFLEASRGARIQVPQLTVQLRQRPPDGSYSRIA